MARKWRDTVSELVDLQEGYRTWLDSLPENLAESATAEALRAICDLDLSELDSVEPPPGFGRDFRRPFFRGQIRKASVSPKAGTSFLA